MRKLSRNSENLLMCIIEAVIGVLLLIDPIGFSKGILMTMGAALVIMGVYQLIQYFREDPEDAAMQSCLAKDLIFMLLGLFLFLKSEWFFITFPIFTMFYGIITLISAISKIQTAVDMKRQNQQYWFVALIGSILSVVCAGLIIANPFTSTAFLWIFIAVTLIFEAVVDIVTWLLGKMKPKYVDAETEELEEEVAL